jgi:hypothetical protein
MNRRTSRRVPRAAGRSPRTRPAPVQFIAEPLELRTLLSAGTTYDPVAEFSTTANPNGVWSYGELPPGAPGFVAYPTPRTLDVGLAGWTTGSSSPPYIGVNPAGAAEDDEITVAIPAGVLDMHPGPDGEYSDLRFTAPSAGPLSVTFNFTGVDTVGTTTDVHVLHNEVSLADGSINAYGDTFGETVSAGTVAAGDTIDFTVGWGTNQDYQYDSTSLTATVTLGGSLSVVQGPPAAVTVSKPIDPAVRVAFLNADGDVDTTATGTVTAAITAGSTGTGTLKGTLTQTAVAGVATFADLSIDKPGDYGLTFTSGGANGTASVDSGPFTVTGDHLVFTEEPEAADVDAPLQFDVAVKDADDKIDHAFTGAVQVSLEASSGTADTARADVARPADLTATAASLIGTTVVNLVNGIAKFGKNLGDKINEVGTYVIKSVEGALSDGVLTISNLVAPGTSTPVDITGLHLVFTRLPTDADADVAIDPEITVTVRDVKDHTVTDVSDVIEFDWALATEPAGINSFTATAAKGVATFVDVRFTTQGVLTLGATDRTTANASLASAGAVPDPVDAAMGSITVLPLHLAFRRLPETADYNTPIEPTPLVAVENTRNQLVKDFDDTLVLTDTPPNGVASGMYTAMAEGGMVDFFGKVLNAVGVNTLDVVDATQSLGNSMIKHGAVDFVNPGTAKITVVGFHLGFVDLPKSLDATVPTAIAVEVLNHTDQVVRTTTDHIALETDDPSAGDTTNYGTLADGITTFSAIVINSVGTVTLHAYDRTTQDAAAADGLTNPVTDGNDSVVVDPLHLVFEQVPYSVAANASFSVQVKVENHEGRVVTGDTDQIQVNAVSGGKGTQEFGTAAAGVATVDQLQLFQSGAGTLTASDLTSAALATAAGIVDPVTLGKVSIFIG